MRRRMVLQYPSREPRGRHYLAGTLTKRRGWMRRVSIVRGFEGTAVVACVALASACITSHSEQRDSVATTSVDVAASVAVAAAAAVAVPSASAAPPEPPAATVAPP